jgi:diacylglycerol kinase
MSLLKSFTYAFQGFKTAFQEQRNLKIHTAAALVVVALGFYFKITSFDWVILLILMGLVIAFELMNSALENLTNLVTREHHPLAGKAKDMAASAVLVVSVVSVIVGFIIFAKYV